MFEKAWAAALCVGEVYRNPKVRDHLICVSDKLVFLTAALTENLTLRVSLSLRLLRRFHQALHLLLQHRHQVPGASFWDARISGPLLDRIDIHIEVPRVEYEKLSDSRFGESSATIQARVEAARQRQRERFAVGAKHSPHDAATDRTSLANASPVQ